MNKTFCDICVKEITGSDYSRFKVKKEWYSWNKSDWERLVVHVDCWFDLRCEIAKRREDNV